MSEVGPAATTVRALEAGDVPSCERILAGLPDWFGLANANAAYIEGLTVLPSAVALDEDGAVVGFVSIRDHGEGSAEIDVMAVDRRLHRRGVGRALQHWAVEWCRAQGFPWLHVKTRGPSTPDPGYEKTRAFWLGVGFAPLFESLTHWGPDDAALVLVMRIDAAR